MLLKQTLLILIKFHQTRKIFIPLISHYIEKFFFLRFYDELRGPTLIINKIRDDVNEIEFKIPLRKS